MNYLDLVSVRDLTTASHQAIQTQNKLAENGMHPTIRTDRKYIRN